MCLEISKVLIVAPNHRAWGNRVIREAESLVRSGYAVTAMMRTDTECAYHGISIVSAPSYSNRLQRLLQVPLVFWRALRLKVDVYHLHNPDMIPVVFLLKLFGKRVIYDTHEDYSRRLLIREWIPPYLRSLLCSIVTFLEIAVCRVADATLVTQEAQVQRFAPRAYLIRNAPYITAELLSNVSEIRKQFRLEADVFRLIYIGGISRQRGLFTMLKALDLVNQECNARLWLAGPDLDSSLIEAKHYPGWQFVDYLGVLKHEEVFAYISKSDIGLAILSNVGDHADARPSKLFEYMAMGKPFIASDFKAWRDPIELEQAGWWVEPEDIDTLSSIIIGVIKDLNRLKDKGEAGQAFISEFNWSNESKVLLEVYKNVLKDSQ